jgi:PKD repeat protein
LASISNLSTPGLDATTVAGDTGGSSTPPDTTGAINSSYYVELVNSELAVYTRALVLKAKVPEDTFAHSSNTCDGQIKWDQTANRWEYYSLDCAASLGSEGYSFGFSKTSSPLPLPSTTSSGNWCGYHVGTGSTLEDYGKLGNNKNFMIIGTNEFNDLTLSYLDSAIFAWPKPANGTKLTSCPAPPSGTEWTDSPASATQELTPEPANEFGSSATGYIVGTTDSTHLKLYSLGGTASVPTLAARLVTVPSYSQPASIPQPGTTKVIDPSDTRLTQANAVLDPTLSKWGIWTQHTVAGSGGGPDVVRWYELAPGHSTPVQTGTISVTNAFAFNGAIAPDGLGNAAAINYNVGSSTTDVSVQAADHPAGSAAGSMTDVTTLATSAGIDQDFSCKGTTPCRWGDYAGASTDPSCKGQVWGTAELNGTPSGTTPEWNTQNFRLTLLACPVASFTHSPTSPTSGSPVTFDGSASTDPSGATITSYSWKFGDGATATGATTSHTYSAAGSYRVTLTVTDSNGLTGTQTQTLTVG